MVLHFPFCVPGELLLLAGVSQARAVLIASRESISPLSHAHLGQVTGRLRASQCSTVKVCSFLKKKYTEWQRVGEKLS